MTALLDFTILALVALAIWTADLPCCNEGHPSLVLAADCWLCRHPVTTHIRTCPACGCLAHYTREGAT